MGAGHTIGLVGPAFVAVLAASAHADARPLGVHDAAPGHPGVTYLDLLRQEIPDLAENATDEAVEGNLTKPLRHLGGPGYEGPPPGPVVVGWLQDVRLKIGGRPRIAVLANLGAGVALLALFDDAPQPKLLDAADVGVDKDTVFAGPSQVALGPGDAALITYSEHDDADLSFGAHLIISPIGDRLKLVDLISTQSANACNWSNVETTNVSSAPDPGRPYRRIEVAVKVVFKPTKDDCGTNPIPKALNRTYRAAFRWNAGRRRFETDSLDLKRLDRLNGIP
ncbi:MAG: hypothetical protein ACHP7N_08175 [Caulobacterales bacterium]